MLEFLSDAAVWVVRRRAWIALFASLVFSFFFFAMAREYQFEHGRFLTPAISTLYRAWWLLVGVVVSVTVLVVVLQGYEFFVFQWRREKGLCIACQHPVGPSVICSECGHGRAVNPTCVSVRLCIVLVLVGLFLGVLAAAFLVWLDDCRAQAYFESIRATGVTGPLLWQRTLVFGGMTITSFDDGTATTFD